MEIKKYFETFEKALESLIIPKIEFSLILHRLSSDDTDGGIVHLDAHPNHIKTVIINDSIGSQPTIELFNRHGIVKQIKLGKTYIVITIAPGEDHGLAVRKGAVKYFVIKRKENSATESPWVYEFPMATK